MWFKRTLNRELMPPWTRRSSLVFVALTLLAGLGALLAVEAYVHTDDGCVVETHCLACLWHQGASSALVMPAVVPDAPASVATEPVVGPESDSPTDGSPRNAPSRGPPLA
jgi:hypothetical protein